MDTTALQYLSYGMYVIGPVEEKAQKYDKV